MIGRTVLAVAVAVVLGAGLMLTPAQGKGGPKCGKVCKPVVDECRAGCDSITSKKDKKRCKNTCKKNALSACKVAPQPHTVDQCGGGSPTAAFVN